jgi:HEAT repeat protein
MARRRRFRPGEPLPSVPDRRAPRGRYDESPIQSRPDRMSARSVTTGEGPATSTWEALDAAARPLLVQLLDDESVARHEALRQRVIATLGQLQVRAAIPRLGEILASRTQPRITRAHAANALGRMGDPAVVLPLARGVDDGEEVVRRQVARALGEIARPEAVAHLQKLSADRSPAVADAAREALGLASRRLGLRLARPRPRKRPARRPPRRRPALDDH